MKQVFTIVTLLMLFATSFSQQMATNDALYSFGKYIFDNFKAGNTDKIIAAIDEELSDDQKEVISLALMTSLEKFKILKTNGQPKMLNVLQKKLKSGGTVLYIPVLIGNKIVSLRIGGVVLKGNTYKITGPVKLVDGKTEKELTNGYKAYMSKCFSCHGRMAEGGIGPNLTDDYWKHVRSEKDIFTVIKEGKTGTMMISYKNFMNDNEIANVTKYIEALTGQKVKKGKAPEGEKVIFDKNIY
jgi:cytochrome c553